MRTFAPPLKNKATLKMSFGEVAEWSIAAVLKTVVPRGTRGSNPCLSAERAGQKWSANGQKATINDLWLFLLPEVLLPRLQKYGKRQSFVTKSLPIPCRTKR